MNREQIEEELEELRDRLFLLTSQRIYDKKLASAYRSAITQHTNTLIEMDSV